MHWTLSHMCRKSNAPRNRNVIVAFLSGKIDHKFPAKAENNLGIGLKIWLSLKMSKMSFQFTYSI